MTARRASTLVAAVLFAALLVGAAPRNAWSQQAGAPAPVADPATPCAGLWVQYTTSDLSTLGSQICAANFMACINGYDEGSWSVGPCPWGAGNCICYGRSLPNLPTPAQCNAEFESCMGLLNPDPIKP
jgi:hypothetical protein